MSRFRWILALTTVVLAALAVGACGDDDDSGSSTSGSAAQSSTPPDNPPTIRIGWILPGSDVQYVMQHVPGVAKNAGTWYKPEWIQFAGSGETVQGLATGSLDAAGVGALTAGVGIAKGADIVLTGSMLEERAPYALTTWIAKKDSGIAGPEDMKGKILGTNSIGSPVYYSALAYLEDAGLKETADYKTVSVPFPQMQDALSSGQIDLAPMPQPFLDAAMATGEFVKVFDAGDIHEPMIQTMMGFRRDFVDDNRQTVEKFQEDYFAAARWLSDPANRAQAIEANTKSTKIPVDVLKTFLLKRNDQYHPPTGELDVETLQSDWDFFQQAGAFDKELDANDHVIPELLKPPESGGEG